MIDPIELSLSKNLYKANIKSQNWQDALRETAEILEADNCITKNYVEKIIEDSFKLNFYYVIGENIAIPHTSPEFGAIKTSIAITTSKNGIYFENHEFNPVKVIFMISVLKTDDHIDFIMKIADILQDREFIYNLSNCENDNELKNVLLNRINS